MIEEGRGGEKGVREYLSGSLLVTDRKGRGREKGGGSIYRGHCYKNRSGRGGEKEEDGGYWRGG